MEIVMCWITQYGYTGIFILLTLGILGLPVPDEIILIFSGFLLSNSTLHFIPTLAVSLLGAILGISLSYGLGRIFGVYILKKFGKIVRITEDKVKSVQSWFNRVGKWGLTFGFFLPGVRHLMAYGAGILKLPFSIFALFTYTGGFLWIITFILLGYFLGEGWNHVSQKILLHLKLSSGLVICLLLIYALVKLMKKKSRFNAVKEKRELALQSQNKQ